MRPLHELHTATGKYTRRLYAVGSRWLVLFLGFAMAIGAPFHVWLGAAHAIPQSEDVQRQEVSRYEIWSVPAVKSVPFLSVDTQAHSVDLQVRLLIAQSGALEDDEIVKYRKGRPQRKEPPSSKKQANPPDAACRQWIVCAAAHYQPQNINMSCGPQPRGCDRSARFGDQAK